MNTNNKTTRTVNFTNSELEILNDMANDFCGYSRDEQSPFYNGGYYYPEANGLTRSLAYKIRRLVDSSPGRLEAKRQKTLDEEVLYVESNWDNWSKSVAEERHRELGMLQEGLTLETNHYPELDQDTWNKTWSKTLSGQIEDGDNLIQSDIKKFHTDVKAFDAIAETA